MVGVLAGCVRRSSAWDASSIVAVLMFTFGAGVTLLEGARHIYHPTPIADAHVSYMVLGASFVFEAITWLIAVRECV
jgi:divalent metal cation (Fe/Co/Zn/Cd) transporter